jgi:hypothetical protein
MFRSILLSLGGGQRPHSWLRLLLPVLAVACARVDPEPVRLLGDRAELSSLQGTWLGRYEADAQDRYGYIEMRIFSQGDSARGDVLMTYHRREDAAVDPTLERAGIQAAQRELLSIRFVRAANGLISGVMAPYNDPECGCQLSTTFTGRLQGDVIKGTYWSQHLNGTHKPTKGTWQAKRSDGSRK